MASTLTRPSGLSPNRPGAHIFSYATHQLGCTVSSTKREPPIPVVLHILVVIPYCVVGALQFAPALRRRRRGWHRAAGKVLAPLGLVAALSGLWMAHPYPWPEGDGELVYMFRLIFGSAMLLSIVLALAAVRRRDFATHGAWVTREDGLVPSSLCCHVSRVQPSCWESCRDSSTRH